MWLDPLEFHATVLPPPSHKGWSPMRHAVKVEGSINSKAGTKAWQVRRAAARAQQPAGHATAQSLCHGRLSAQGRA
jgi:hypothetical protein